MPLYLDSFKNNQQADFNYNTQLNGLDTFIKSIERYLFADIHVHSVRKGENTIHLIIEAYCNFNLFEAVTYTRTGIWGSEVVFRQKPFFLKALSRLKSENSELTIDIDELSILLKDTTIIVNRIYDESIPHHLQNIIQELTNNHLYLTKGETEVPFEIYTPVFEENFMPSNTPGGTIEKDFDEKADYFSFWGLYFNSQEDAVIYDLANKSIVYADLYMLNH